MEVWAADTYKHSLNLILCNGITTKVKHKVKRRIFYNKNRQIFQPKSCRLNTSKVKAILLAQSKSIHTNGASSFVSLLLSSAYWMV